MERMVGSTKSLLNNPLLRKNDFTSLYSVKFTPFGRFGSSDNEAFALSTVARGFVFVFCLILAFVARKILFSYLSLSLQLSLMKEGPVYCLSQSRCLLFDLVLVFILLFANLSTHNTRSFLVAHCGRRGLPNRTQWSSTVSNQHQHSFTSEEN